MLDYNEWKLSDLPSLETSRRREGKILDLVTVYGDSGISHGELAHIIGIDRKTLRPYMKILIGKGLVDRGKGKQGKYYPATKNYRGTIWTADLLSKAAVIRILMNEDFPIDSPFFSNKITNNDGFENALSIFSIKIGFIITYLLIQSMNPSNKFAGDTKNDEEKDLNVKRWIDEAISSLQPSSLYLKFFKDSVINPFIRFSYSVNKDFINSNGSIEDFENNAEARDKFGDRYMSYLLDRPLYTLDEGLANELIASFHVAYPSMMMELEKIRSRLPEMVDRQKSEWDYMAISHKQQNHCNHKFEPPLNKALAKHTKNTKHCRKCHLTKYDPSLFYPLKS